MAVKKSGKLSSLVIHSYLKQQCIYNSKGCKILNQVNERGTILSIEGIQQWVPWYSIKKYFPWLS